MKRALIVISALLSVNCTWAQYAADSVGVVAAAGKFVKLDKEPEFPGGLTALVNYIAKNVQYPDSAFDNNVEGIVSVLFNISQTGKVTDARIEHSIGYGCDEEALRLVRMMPAWSPGIYNGQAVKVLYRLPIHFSIPDKIPENPEDINNAEPVYHNVDQSPEFPGGKAALIRFLTERVPELRNKNKFKGMTIEFRVQSNGTVDSIRLLKPSQNNIYLQDRLSEMVTAMPAWTPATTNGKKVSAYYDLAIDEFETVR